MMLVYVFSRRENGAPRMITALAGSLTLIYGYVPRIRPPRKTFDGGGFQSSQHYGGPDPSGLQYWRCKFQASSGSSMAPQAEQYQYYHSEALGLLFELLA